MIDGDDDDDDDARRTLGQRQRQDSRGHQPAAREAESSSQRRRRGLARVRGSLHDRDAPRRGRHEIRPRRAAGGNIAITEQPHRSFGQGLQVDPLVDGREGVSVECGRQRPLDRFRDLRHRSSQLAFIK